MYYSHEGAPFKERRRQLQQTLCEHVTAVIPQGRWKYTFLIFTFHWMWYRLGLFKSILNMNVIIKTKWSEVSETHLTSLSAIHRPSHNILESLSAIREQKRRAEMCKSHKDTHIFLVLEVHVWRRSYALLGLILCIYTLTCSQTRWKRMQWDRLTQKAWLKGRAWKVKCVKMTNMCKQAGSSCPRTTNYGDDAGVGKSWGL